MIDIVVEYILILNRNISETKIFQTIKIILYLDLNVNDTVKVKIKEDEDDFS